jgi:hypothetical protein
LLLVEGIEMEEKPDATLVSLEEFDPTRWGLPPFDEAE